MLPDVTERESLRTFRLGEFRSVELLIDQMQFLLTEPHMLALRNMSVLFVELHKTVQNALKRYHDRREAVGHESGNICEFTDSEELNIGKGNKTPVTDHVGHLS
jgi:hypothetical protein